MGKGALMAAWTAMMALLPAGWLGPTYPDCESDNQCHGQEVCVYSTCLRCALDSHCPQEQECRAYQCQPRVQCSADTDCKGGLVCKQNKCAPQCTADADCAAGQACQQNKCVSMAESCAVTSDCPAGKACRAGSCFVPREGDPEYSAVYGKPTPAPAPVEQPLSGADITGGRMLCGEEVRVYFAFNDSGLTDESRQMLGRAAACLKSLPNQAVLVQGHTDERGNTEYNLALGERRALAVRLYLRDLGVDVRRMTPVSLGEERPLDAGHDEAAWAKNRRAEILPKP